jgi:heme/copper-type cytochrome/quinol oxidase subunit 3
MIRIALTEIVLFALPFVAFAVYRLTTRGHTGEAVERMPWPVFALTVAGGVLVIAGFVAFAWHDGRDEERGHYVPAHTEGGELVPGRFATD